MAMQMAMGWTPMCGQTWPAAAASFVGMWAPMMVAMMLPSIAPTLWRLWRRPRRGAAALFGAGYFLVWSALGVAVFALGAALAEAQLRSRTFEHAAPVAAALVVLLGGAWQLSAWKARALAHCRSFGAHATHPWMHGMRLGLHCCISCAGLTAILLVAGMMDWRAMLLATVAITAERLAPAGERVARVVGAGAVAAGLFLMAG
jgi:predicted metal-binding membrane protein